MSRAFMLPLLGLAIGGVLAILAQCDPDDGLGAGVWSGKAGAWRVSLVLEADGGWVCMRASIMDGAKTRMNSGQWSRSGDALTLRVEDEPGTAASVLPYELTLTQVVHEDLPIVEMILDNPRGPDPQRVLLRRYH